MRMFRVIFMIWLGGVLCGSGAVRAETITVATGDWPPSLEEKARHHGFSNHMVKRKLYAVPPEDPAGQLGNFG